MIIRRQHLKPQLKKLFYWKTSLQWRAKKFSKRKKKNTFHWRFRILWKHVCVCVFRRIIIPNKRTTLKLGKMVVIRVMMAPSLNQSFSPVSSAYHQIHLIYFQVKSFTAKFNSIPFNEIQRRRATPPFPWSKGLYNSELLLYRCKKKKKKKYFLHNRQELCVQQFWIIPRHVELSMSKCKDENVGCPFQ